MVDKKGQLKTIASIFLILLLTVVFVVATDADWATTRYIYTVTDCATSECNRTGGTLGTKLINLQNISLDNSNLYRITVEVNQTINGAVGSLSAPIKDFGLDSSFVIGGDNESIFDFNSNGVIDDDINDAGNVTTVPTNWWSSAWRYRKPIILKETVGTSRTNEPVEVNITNLKLSTNKCVDEIRVIDSNNNETPNQILDSSGENEIYGSHWCMVLFLTNIPANNNITYYIYYGNPNADNPEYEAINLFYEDFEDYAIGSNASPTWVIDSGNWSISEDDGNKVFKQNDTSDFDSLAYPVLELYNFTAELKIKHTQSAIQEDNNGLFFRFLYTDTRYGTYLNGPDENRTVLDKKINGSWSYMGDQYGDWHQTYNTWTHLRVLANGSTIKSYTNYTSLILNATEGNLTVGSIALFSRGSIVYFDDIKIWKVGVTPYPTKLNTTLGSEEVVYKTVQWNPVSGTALSSLDYGGIANFSYIMNPNLVIGNYWFNFSAEGGVNDAGISNSIIFEDLKGPEIYIEGPGVDFDGNITFAYHVSDISGIANCSLILDGSLNQTDYSVEELISQAFDLSSLSGGVYEWSVNCTDNSNNLNTRGSIDQLLVVDITAPSIVLNSPTDNSQDSNGNVSFNFTVQDDGLVINCSLYHDISGTWQKNQTLPGIEKNASLYFVLSSIPDDTTFKWNVECYDISKFVDWGNINYTLIINNTPPTLSSNIPNQTWGEDNYTIINLNEYFLDSDSDNLLYTFTDPTNVTVSVSNETGIVILESNRNWFGNKSIIFTASDGIETTGSNNITLTVNELGDTAPRFTFASPIDNFNDTDGYITFRCNVTDDYNLVNVSFYINTTKSWQLNQTKEVSGTDNSTIFNLTNLPVGSYLWGCLVYDNNSQSKWSENRTVKINIKGGIDYDLPTEIINTLNTSRTVTISYSAFLNDSLTLGRLIIYESDGELYFSKNMSNSSRIEESSENVTESDPPPLNFHPQKINITPYDIFDGNLTVGNIAGLNITIEYYYQGIKYEEFKNLTIEIKAPLPLPS